MLRRISQRLKKAGAALALLSVEMAIVVSLFATALVTFIWVTRRVFVLKETAFDQAIFDFLNNHVSDRNNSVIKAFTFLGSHDFLIPANLSLIAYYLFIRKHKWYSIKVPAIALSSLGLMFLLKNLFNRPRPDIPLLYEARGLSFPSGHALMSITFYGLLIHIFYHNIKNKGWRWTLISFLVLLILVIGFTRVYLRVHYTTDVLAGYCIGFIWLVFAIWLLNRIEQNNKRKLTAMVESNPAPAGITTE